VTFIDIDYKELMLKKRDVVQSTKELSSMLGKFEILEEGDILLRSENYLQLVCGVIPVLFWAFQNSENILLLQRHVPPSMFFLDQRMTDSLVYYRDAIFET
jgi:hypothetical protein